MENFHVQQWTRIGAMNRGGVPLKRRILAGVGLATLCRDAATLGFMEGQIMIHFPGSVGASPGIQPSLFGKKAGNARPKMLLREVENE